MRNGRCRGIPIPWLGHMADSRAGRPRDRAAIPHSALPYYAATAYVPPHTADTGLGSFILRNFDDGARRSSAEGRWLLTNKTISWAKGRESMSDYSGTYMNMRG